METELKTLAGQMWDAAEAMSTYHQQRWVRNKLLATSQHVTPRRIGQSNLFIPKTEAYIHRKMGDFVGAFSTNFYSFLPTPQGTKAGAKIIEGVVDYYLTTHGTIEWIPIVMNLAKNALTYNYAPFLVDWVENVEEQTVITEKLTENGVKIVEDTVKVDKGYPIIEEIPPEDFFIDPTVGWNEVKYARYAVVRKWVDRAFYEEQVEADVWEDVVPEELFTDEFGMKLRDPLKVARLTTQGDMLTPGSDKHNGLLEIHKFYFYYDHGEGLEPSYMCLTGDHQYILEMPTPLANDFTEEDGSDPWPFGIGMQFIEPHQVYSRALPEKLEPLQIEINAIRNQRRDNVAQVLNREKYMTPEAGVDPATLSRSYAGKVTVVRNLNAIKWDLPPDITSSAYNEENAAQSDMDQLIGESAMRLGAPGPRKETATTARIMASNAEYMTGLDVTVFGLTAIKPIIRKLAKLIKQNAPEELFAAVAEHLEIQAVDPYREALGKFKLMIGSGAMQSQRDAVMANVSNLVALVQSTYGPNANYKPLVGKVLETQGFKVDEVIPDPNEQQHPAFGDLGGVEGTGALGQQQQAMMGGQFGSVATEDNQRKKEPQ